MKHAWLAVCLILAAASATAAETDATNPESSWDEPPMIGMYVHQHWSYNHPYAARTWSMDDWSGYLGALSELGYNIVLIWPVLETMPNPLTPSDEENLEKIAQVIDLAHDELDMRVLIVICPNVVAKDEEARKYDFVDRPFFYTDKRIDPADAVAMGEMMAFREEIFTPLKEADGVFIIDSDPGGYPGSTNLEFVSLLNMHRTMLDKLNPEIELYYWMHAGWEAYCRFYETAEFAMGERHEILDTMELLGKADPEPWGIASGSAWGPEIGDELGMSGRVMSFAYGGIEGEPSFPMANFDTPRAYDTGAAMGARGTMGNAQTHCIQLPNTFLFAQGAAGAPRPERADYVAFAERLLPGHGAVVVAGWEALNTADAAAMRDAIEGLDPLADADLETGDLDGLLFGDPQRFVRDLIQMLAMRAAYEDFHAAAMGDAPDAEVGAALKAFADAAGAWQQTHDYKNRWWWPRMHEALIKVEPEVFTPIFSERDWKGEGDTPFEQVQDAFKQVETFTPMVLEALHATAADLMQDE